MEKLENLVQEVLDDTLWEAECVMRSDRSKNITVITDNLRGVCGITVVTVTGPAERIGKHVERTILNVKFFRLCYSPITTFANRRTLSFKKYPFSITSTTFPLSCASASLSISPFSSVGKSVLTPFC